MATANKDPKSSDAATRRRPAVLVTGAAGYVGRLTVDALAGRRDQLAALVALDVREVEPGARRDGVVYLAQDIREVDFEALLREHAIDTVVHLASIVRPPPGAGAELAYEVDVVATRRLLEACVAVGARKLIVTSSGAAYGYHADNPAWLDEADAIRGNDEFVYARNKRLVEQLLADYRAAHPELAQLVFRPGTVLGATVSNPITDHFERRAIIGVWGSESPFVFIWDEDVVACLVEGVFGDKAGIYNLAGDGAMSPREIARALGKPYVPLPAAVLRVALGALHRLGRLPYGGEQVKFLRYRPVLSNDRLKREFGYTPKLTSRQTFELYRLNRQP